MTFQPPFKIQPFPRDPRLAKCIEAIDEDFDSNTSTFGSETSGCNTISQSEAHEANLTRFRQEFDAARDFDDDDLFFKGPGQTTRHDLEVAILAEKAEEKKEDAKMEQEAKCSSYRKTWYTQGGSPCNALPVERQDSFMDLVGLGAQGSETTGSTGTMDSGSSFLNPEATSFKPKIV